MASGSPMPCAGLVSQPSLKLNGVEMIFALSQAYEDAVSLEQVGAELGLKKEEFARSPTMPARSSG